MDWLLAIFTPGAPVYSAVVQALIVLGLVAASGIAIGSFRFFGVSIGVAGVLFSGLAFAHFGLTIQPELLDFIREFGLILFVYTIGIQVGPGLVSSLRRDGMRLNGLAIAIVILGLLITLGIHYFAAVPTPAVAGLFSGATTNTPSLAAAQQALREKTDDPEIRSLPGLAYAISYPLGVLGLIFAMLLLRFVFHIDVGAERKIFIQAEEERKQQLNIMNLEVQNRNLEGLTIRDIPYEHQSGVVISRIMQNGTVQLAQPEMSVHLGDVLMAVGPKEELEKLRIMVGAESSLNLMEIKSDIAWGWLVVTKKAALGKSVQDLKLRQHFGVTIARIARADIELPVSPQVKLQFGDRLSAVGSQDSLQRAATELGNSPKELNHPMLIPVFVGIVLGVLVGSYPITLPGLPAPVRLGLAGGPLLIAIILSRIGKIGPLVWHMPISANYMLREIGISLFLACVGLKSGDKFVDILIHGNGLRWMALAMLITLIPPLVVGFIARFSFKLNYLLLCGLLSGSMTDPPALAYASAACDSEAPSIAYATVYPLVIFLRVLLAQLLVIYF